MNIFDINIIHFDFVVLVCTSKNEKFWISSWQKINKQLGSTWSPFNNYKGFVILSLYVLWRKTTNNWHASHTCDSLLSLHSMYVSFLSHYRFHFTPIFNHSCNLLNLLHSDHAKLILHFPLKESHLLLIQMGSLFFIWTVGKFIIVSSSATHLLVITKSPKH